MDSLPYVEYFTNKFEISFPLFVIELNLDMFIASGNLTDALELDFACVDQLVNEVDLLYLHHSYFAGDAVPLLI